MLLLTAFIWGTGFIAQSKGMDKIEAFTFNGIRTLIAAAALFPFILIKELRFWSRADNAEKKTHKLSDRKTLLYGTVIGIAFCAAGNFQQLAFNYTTTGKIAFITALYMFFVPIIGLFFGKKVPLLTWLCVLAGFVGLYFLCIDPTNDIGFNKGDVLTLCCAFLYAVHILLVEKYSPDLDGVKLSFVQFTVSGLITLILMFIFENPDFELIKQSALPILYGGVISSGVAYTMQIIGQKYTEATVASLILCTESVFAVVCAIPILHEHMSVRETVGSIIMFSAILLSQLSDKISLKIRELKTSRNKIK